MDYQQALEYIHSIQWRGSRLGLSRTIELLTRLDHPEEQLKFVHVAGTNGKGSTSAMLASILQASGYRVGLYTSPFIDRFNERMQIDGIPIADDELARLTETVRPFAEQMSDSPTEFELITAIAFLYFCEKKCDIVVLEVGMGGELDSTNAIPVPELAIITNIGYDHTSELGPTLTDIARAKSGIIKDAGDVVSYGHNEEADAVIHQACQRHHATLTIPDFSLLEERSISLERQIFDYGEMKALTIPLVGSYQLYNAAVVLTAVDRLRSHGWEIDDSAIRDGLRTVHWPARFEVLRNDPVCIVDGGHNPQGVAAVVKSLQNHFPGQRIVFLLAVMADKDVEQILDIIQPIAKACVAVTSNHARSLPPGALCQRIAAHGMQAYTSQTIPDGVALAMQLAGTDGIMCALGSLYLAGGVRSALKEI